MNKNRSDIKLQFGGLYRQAAAILFRYDPMGINFEDNSDEYEPEVDTILPKLTTAGSEADVLEIVYQEFCQWFGPELVGQKSDPAYKKIAAELWSVWQVFPGNGL